MKLNFMAKASLLIISLATFVALAKANNVAKCNDSPGFTVLTPQLLRLLQVHNESKRNPIYGSRFYSAYEKYYKNNRNTK